MNRIISAFVLTFACYLTGFSQLTQEIGRVYNFSGDFSDRYTCITKDNQGNIIAAGSSVNSGTARDFLITKFNSNHQLVWKKIFNGSGNGADEVLGVVTDAQNNIYVTGFQKGAGAGNDFLTQKYDSNGSLVWSSVFNTPYNEYDQSNAIALDANGNVFIVGQSDNDPSPVTNDDYVTVKYNNAGVEQWSQRFNGLGNGIDRGIKIATDASGTVIVTGRSFNGSDDDYVTIKYNSAGTQLWKMTEDRTNTDRPTDMKVDAAGNVFVTGRSKAVTYDFYTAKYSPAGARLWAKAYNNLDDDRATALAIDAAGNAFVAGQIDDNASTTINSYNATILKYDAAGNQAWVATNVLAGSDEIPSAIDIAANGFIYAVGEKTNILSDAFLLGVNTTGGIVTNTNFNGAANKNDVANAMTIDASANLIVAGYSENAKGERDAALLKYASTGTILGQHFLTGQGDNNDNIRDIAIDGAGNTYIAGYGITFNADRNFTILKINTNGDTLWTRRLDGSSPGSLDEAVDIALDANGNVYATGWTKNSGQSNDATTVKLDANGNFIWQQAFNGVANESDRGAAIIVAPNGTIYVAGRTDTDPSSTASNDNALLLAYTNAGTLLWSKQYNGTGNSNDRFTNLRLNADGTLFAIGRTWNGTNDDFLVIKYDGNGNALNTAVIDGGNGNDNPLYSLLAADGNLYVVGQTGEGNNSDAVLMKYNSAGALEWNKKYVGSATAEDFFASLTVSPDGTIYAGGGIDEVANPLAPKYKGIIIKYDINGNQIGEYTQSNTTSFSNEVTNIIAADNNTILAAFRVNIGTSTDNNDNMSLVALNNALMPQFTQTFNGTADSTDVSSVMKLVNNKLYIGGSSQTTNAQRDMALLRFAFLPLSSQNQLENINISLQPNPFIDKITLNSADLSLNSLTISLIDGLGRNIPIDISNNSDHQVNISPKNSLPNGYYFILYHKNGKIIGNQRLIKAN